MTDGPLRVLVVGSGRRVRNNYLPALRAMPGEFEVAGVHSRNPENFGPVAEAWGVRPVPALDAAALEGVDVVAISVPTSANAEILAALRQRLGAAGCARMRILLDTPIAWSKDELKAILPLLQGWRQVTAAEDYMNYPPFALLRRAVAAGFVGRPAALTLTNTGFLFHGLALIRSLVGFEPVFRTARLAFGSAGAAVSYRFRSGFEAHVVGPYRSHSTGGLVLEGDKGLVTEFPADLKREPNRPWHLLEYERQDGILSACRISGPAGDLREETPAIAAMHAMPVGDRSELNLLRGCGLMTVFRSLRDPADMNNRYGPHGALYDSFVSQRATRGQFPLDPFVLAGTNAVAAFARTRGVKAA